MNKKLTWEGMTKTIKQQIGSWGEEHAAKFLKNKGYEIIAQNILIRGGEIDIIAWHDKPFFGKTLCIVEVKTRSYGIGSAERATKGKKLNTILNTAKKYCSKIDLNIQETAIQFEQISVYGKPPHAPSIKHHIIPIFT